MTENLNINFEDTMLNQVTILSHSCDFLKRRPRLSLQKVAAMRQPRLLSLISIYILGGGFSNPNIYSLLVPNPYINCTTLSLYLQVGVEGLSNPYILMFLASNPHKQTSKSSKKFFLSKSPNLEPNIGKIPSLNRPNLQWELWGSPNYHIYSFFSSKF